MAAGLFGILAKVVIGHVREAEPHGECQANPPRQYDTPEDPVRYAEDQADVFGRAVIAQEVSGADAPGQVDRPDRHDEKALAASVPQELLFLTGWFVGLAWHGGSSRVSVVEIAVHALV